MLLFTRKKLAFFHIPKTAGSTIEYLLKDFSNKDTSRFRRRIISKYIHESLSDKLQVVDNNLLNDVDIFTIVRNPFDLSISLYSWIKTSPISPLNKVFLNFNEARKAAQELEFNDWISEYFVKNHPSFFDYLNINGQIPEKIIILEFENLKADFIKLNDQYTFGINCNLLDKTKARKSQHEHFSKVYNKKSYELVREKYKWYFETFKKGESNGK